MNGPYQLPPILSGSAENQLRQLRDYLVRLARELPTETQIAQAVQQSVKPGSASPASSPQTVRAAQEQSEALKALIIKTANDVRAQIDVIETTLSSSYVAISDYGSYYENIKTKVEQTAKSTIEDYEYEEGVTLLDKIGGVDGELGALSSQITTINGEIMRGFISVAGVGDVFGIAVAENIQIVAGGEQTVGDVTYQQIDIDRMKALGLYTATGWQFWINGRKAGWFDADDGMLHVPQIVVERSLKLGAEWEITQSGGFGLRYVGS